MMKKIIIFILSLMIAVPVFAQTLLQSGVEIKHVPNSFYGNWRVVSKLVSTSNSALFKQKSLDMWNLSRENSVIKLENPFSGASQTVVVKNAKSDFIKFVKVGNYNGKRLTDEVTLNLGKNSFWGVNEIKLDTVSDIDGHVLKREYATYHLKGEKLSGTSVGE